MPAPLNKLNEDVAKAMDTMLDREILVSDSTVGSIRMKLDEFVKPEDMVSVRMKNENYHEKLTGEFYENEQPIIDAFNEGYLCPSNVPLYGLSAEPIDSVIVSPSPKIVFISLKFARLFFLTISGISLNSLNVRIS